MSAVLILPAGAGAADGLSTAAGALAATSALGFGGVAGFDAGGDAFAGFSSLASGFGGGLSTKRKKSNSMSYQPVLAY